MRLALATAIGLLFLSGPAPAWADPVPGLVAAYSFDEGSGTVVNDASGNGNLGSITGATWSSGRYGGALSFNGTNAHVSLGSLGTFYQQAFTLEAWVQKQSATKNDVAVLGSWTGNGGPMVWVDHLATRYHATFGNSLPGYLDSGANPAAAQWQHIAATFDGTTARFYIDGGEVASRAISGGVGSSNTWRVGAYGSTPSGFFDGLIDDVRIYDRALSAGEVQADKDTPVGFVDTGAPTKPGNFVVTGTTQSSVSVQWDASTDEVGVLGYAVYLNGASVATTGATSFTFPGLSCGITYQFGVEAYDAAGNVSQRALMSASAQCGNPTGLVAAYSFDEGAGGQLSDASGNGHFGTITGATWTAGHTNGALSFNGTDAHVSLGSLGTFYQQAFTLEAWVRKQSASKNDVAVLGTWNGNGPMLWVDHLATRYHLTLGSSLGTYLDSGANPVAAQWQHLAATFDGTTARFYIDGAEVANRAVSGSVGSSNTWRIGAYGGTPSGFFDGLVDDVRVYDRALSAAEIVSDKNQPVPLLVPPSDTTPPTPPGQPAATVLPSRATLTWGAATDNVGVVKFNVHRSTVSGFTPSEANRIAQPTTLSYTDDDLPAGIYYYKVTAEDAAGNVSSPSSQASADVPPPDTVQPTVSITGPTGGIVSGTIAASADAADQWGVAGVQFKLDGQDLGAEDTAAPFDVSWDTRGELNGTHTLTAVARDGAGNSATSAQVVVTVSNAGVSSAGLRASYGLDETAGTSAADSSGNNKTGTLVNAGWSSAGRFGGGLSLNGTSGSVDLPAFGTFYKTAFTYEAWVFKQSSKVDVGLMGAWAGGVGGAMIWVDHAAGHYRLTLGTSFGDYLDSGRSPAVGRWQHVAATYDGAVARIYVDGVETASTTYTGNVGNSNTWRIGAYGGTAAGFFDGLVDNVRIYDRALSGTEIQVDMASRIQPDPTPPTVTAKTPADGSAGLNVGLAATATLSKPMNAGTITSSTFVLRDHLNVAVPTNVSYNPATKVATLTPQSALQYGETYTATVEGGPGGVADTVGNVLTADVSWSFTTEASPPQVLVVASTANPFGAYLGEVLRAEGLNAFTTIDIVFLSPSVLSQFDVVLLGDMSLSAAQVSALTSWVESGGNLVAMRPDKQLAGLLGLTDAAATLTNGYLQVDTSAGPGAGIVGSTIQYHGSADQYTLNGATAVATLYSDAATATANPAVTLRSVGSNGGQAAAFTFDLARSVVLTRQGNPAFAGQENDGVVGIRPSDMFFSGAQGDWLDKNKIAIPQADEQQRLLLNLITHMELDKLPLPRFWYLPRGEKAAVVMSGDDHAPSQAPGGTASNFERFKQLSPPGCVVADWECVRASSYNYPDGNLTNAQAAGYLAEGFEIALHPVISSCPTAPISEAALASFFDTQLAAWQAAYSSQPAPATSRTHCVFWPDWASSAKVELARGIRMDTNYYHYPPAWIGSSPGFMTGGGFPMRFADLDGSTIDVYQGHTHITDESTTQFEPFIDALLDNAVGPLGYYGAFGANIHTDNPAPLPGAEAIVAAAQARSVPVISYKQLLDWTDGRNASTIRGLDWAGGTFTFVTTVGAGANGLQTMLPTEGPSGTLSALSCAGSPKSYTLQTVKGVEYAMFDAITGACQATYS